MKEETSAKLRDIFEAHLTHMNRQQNALIEFTKIMTEPFSEAFLTREWLVHHLKSWRRLLLLFEPMMESHQDTLEDWNKVMELLLKDVEEE